MRRLVATVVVSLALLAAAAPATYAAGGDAGNGNQPNNAHACQAILFGASNHTPGAANGEAIAELIGAFCF